METIPKEARKWAMLAHGSGFALFTFIPFINIALPLVVWLLMKDVHPYVDQQGRRAINFQISVTLYILASVFMIIFLVGIPLLIAVSLGAGLLTLVALIKANDGEDYDYPLTIPLIR